MITYSLDLSDNPNLPRIIDTAKRNFNIDFQIDYVIEHVGDCLRLIGKNAYTLKKESYVVKNNKIDLPCYADSIYEICPNIPFNLIGKTIHVYDIPDNTNVEITYRIFQTDNNGFPLVDTEEEYYACYHWILYQYFLSKFAMGLEKGDRLQYFENLKDRYINQARSSLITINKMQGYVDLMKTPKLKRKGWK